MDDVTEEEKRALKRLIETGNSSEGDLSSLLSLVDKGYLSCDKGEFDSLRQSGPTPTYSWYSTEKGKKLINQMEKVK